MQVGFGLVTTNDWPYAGGGKGSWSAWKAGELSRRYEAAGGDYKVREVQSGKRAYILIIWQDTGDNKNKAQKGAPEKKDGEE